MTTSLRSAIIECKVSSVSDTETTKVYARRIPTSAKATLPHVDSRNFDICIRELSLSLYPFKPNQDSGV